jgi:hypothetical protein
VRVCLQAARTPTEPSEEVRVALAGLLNELLRSAGGAVGAYAAEVWALLQATLADPSPEVAVQGCAAAQQLAGVCELLSLSLYA